MSSSWSSRHFSPPIFLSCNIVFYKTVPEQDVTNQVTLPSVYCRRATNFLTWLYAALLHFPHSWTKLVSPSSSSTTFQSFQLFLICFLKWASFSTLKIIYCKCSNLFIFSKKIMCNLLLEIVFIFECSFRHGNTRHNFPCTPCIIWYYARLIFQVFQIILFSLSNMTCALYVCF